MPLLDGIIREGNGLMTRFQMAFKYGGLDRWFCAASFLLFLVTVTLFCLMVIEVPPFNCSLANVIHGIILMIMGVVITSIFYITSIDNGIIKMRGLNLCEYCGYSQKHAVSRICVECGN